VPTEIEIFAEMAGDYPAEVGAIALKLANTILISHPELMPRALPGWRALSFHHPKAGYVCGVFLMVEKTSLVFEHGRLLSDPEGILEGQGARVRFVPFAPGREISHGMIWAYINEAISIKA